VRLLVLDTNVLVSGMISSRGAPARIIDLLREGELELVVDDRILDEYIRVLRRPHFRQYFTEAECRDIVSYLENNTARIVADVLISGLPDESDTPFAETAVASGVPLVTGNTRHFPRKKCRDLDVMTPAEFLRSLQA